MSNKARQHCFNVWFFIFYIGRAFIALTVVLHFHNCCKKICSFLDNLFLMTSVVKLFVLITHTHAHTRSRTQPFYCSLYFVWDYSCEPVPEETFTHSHLSWSLIILYLLPSSTIIHGILPVQFMCLIVFLYNFFPSLLQSTSWSGTLHFILHIFLHPIIVFAAHDHTITNCFAVVLLQQSSNTSLSFSTLYSELCLLPQCHTSI